MVFEITFKISLIQSSTKIILIIHYLKSIYSLYIAHKAKIIIYKSVQQFIYKNQVLSIVISGHERRNIFI